MIWTLLTRLGIFVRTKSSMVAGPLRGPTGDRTYRYDDSEYTKMILGYHATFFATCILKLREIQFWPSNLHSYRM